jgi:ubiquinone/menaquinone biosynthesis C-methylase UbiE
MRNDVSHLLEADSVVVTLVLCSVADPERGLHETWRVLKPGGTLLLFEHVRGQGTVVPWIQDALIPLTTRCMGNRHWNRNTQQLILDTGFQITQIRQLSGELQPMLFIQATRPETL